jgi:hypothetical protein
LAVARAAQTKAPAEAADLAVVVVILMLILLWAGPEPQHKALPAVTVPAESIRVAVGVAEPVDLDHLVYE